jgi:hypothetical protein
LRYLTTFVGSLLTGFERYLRSAGLDPRIVGGMLYEQMPLWLTDDELVEAIARWTELLEPLRGNEPDRGRRRMLLSLAMFPDAAAGAQVT